MGIAVGYISVLPVEVFTAELSRVGGPIDSAFALGPGVLPTTTSSGEEASCGGACFSLQMDSHPVSLLEGG